MGIGALYVCFAVSYHGLTSESPKEGTGCGLETAKQGEAVRKTEIDDVCIALWLI